MALFKPSAFGAGVTLAVVAGGVRSILTVTETELDQLREQRAALRLRHAQALTSLMDERTDLRGVHALADHFDDAVRWSA